MSHLSAPLYLLRHPAHTLSPALYSPQDVTASVLLLETTPHSPISPRFAATLQSGERSRVPIARQLSYGQLLELIIQAEKVVTL